MKTPTIQDLINHIQNDEIVKCSVTESIHRFYYDKCFNPYTERPFETDEVKIISRIHNYFSCLYAGWRFKIKKRFARYDGWEDTTALNIDSFSKNNHEATLS